MYKDAQEELQRLEDALLQEELQENKETDELDELDVLLAETRRLVGMPEEGEDDYLITKEDITKTRRVYNTDRTEGNLDDLSDSLLEEPPQKSLAGLIVTAGVLSAGIVAVLIWWLVRLGGLF